MPRRSGYTLGPFNVRCSLHVREDLHRFLAVRNDIRLYELGVRFVGPSEGLRDEFRRILEDRNFSVSDYPCEDEHFELSIGRKQVKHATRAAIRGPDKMTSRHRLADDQVRSQDLMLCDS